MKNRWMGCRWGEMFTWLVNIEVGEWSVGWTGWWMDS